MSRADGQLSTAPKKHKVSLLTLIRKGFDLSILLGLAKPEGLNAELLRKLLSSVSSSVSLLRHMAVKTPTEPHLGARSLYIYTGCCGEGSMDGVVVTRLPKVDGLVVT